MFLEHAHFFWPLLFIGRFFWLIVLGLLAWAVIRSLTRRPRSWMPPYVPPMPHTAFPQPSAMEILRQRFARGEIDAVTFDHMRERLEASERPRQAQS